MGEKNESMISKISDKMIAVGMITGFVVSLVPIIILAFYNYPCADDFSASDTAHWAWVNTGSVIEVVKAAVENVIYNYLKWSGVYVSVFWTSLQPGLFGEQFYGVTTVISIVLFVVAGGYLIYVIGSKYMKGNKYSWQCIGILYLFTSIQCMPDGNEGLYWHAGGANYTWAFAFLLLLTAYVLEIYKEENKTKKIRKLIAACIVAVLVGGGNYITALQGCVWLVLIDAIMLFAYKKKKSVTCEKKVKVNIGVIIPTLILIAAFLASVLAPGNNVRMGLSEGLSPVNAVIESFKYALTIPLNEWLDWQVCILLAIALPFMWNIVKQQEYKFAYPAVAVLLGYCLIAAGFTPSLYSQGMMQAGRLHDTVYFILILMLFIIIFYIMGWIYCKKYKQNDFNRQKKGKQELTVREKRYILSVLFIWGACSVLYMGINTEIYVGTQALYSLISGQAQTYRQENEKRLELLESTEEKVILPKFSEVPSLLQFDDISPNPEEWLNSAMAGYYGKESVQREE